MGCVRPGSQPAETEQANTQGAVPAQQDQSESGSTTPAVQDDYTPSDVVESTPTAREHIVSLGETLGTIAEQYGTNRETLITINKIEDANLLLPGRVLLIPDAGQEYTVPVNTQLRADSDIITDHDLVYGPTAKEFNLEQFLHGYSGYLLSYEEEVEGRQLEGPAIVQLVADRHSVNPRLLLAVLEYNAGWLTEQDPQNIVYMMGYEKEGVEGLYKQLSWATNLLNWGFYGRSDGGASTFLVGDTEVSFSPEISDGTAGVQNYLGARDEITYQEWLIDVGPDGLAATYRQLFGDTSANETAAVLPDNLQQPPLLLPWASGETWYFTGGPHGGWNTGSAWAALDFVPDDVEYGCTPSDDWVTAVADGVIARSGSGAVVLDMDGDGYAGSGWAITYMHLDDNQRIVAGTRVAAGDPLGHPGCEGGFANGTHLHLARTYNGRWISADGSIPLNLDGWLSSGVGYEYNGWLERDGVTKTADVYHTEENAITAN